jgi:superoxide dismutase
MFARPFFPIRVQVGAPPAAALLARVAAALWSRQAAAESQAVSALAAIAGAAWAWLIWRRDLD